MEMTSASLGLGLRKPVAHSLGGDRPAAAGRAEAAALKPLPEVVRQCPHSTGPQRAINRACCLLLMLPLLVL